MIFDVVINLKAIFDVVIVSKFFDVLFGFQRCDFRSSDLFPYGERFKIAQIPKMTKSGHNCNTFISVNN